MMGAIFGGLLLVALLAIIVGVVVHRKRQETGLDRIRAAAPPLANVVHNRAFADPNQQLPYGGDEVGVPHVPVRGNGAAINVQPAQSMYEEADPKRAPIYDAGNLAGAAAHALRDQRRASQLVAAAAVPLEDAAYEEIEENITPASGGKRRSTVGAADRCERPAPTGGMCTNVKVHGGNFCNAHVCEQPGCNQGKSSRVTACPTHLVAAAAGGNAGIGLVSESLYTNDAYGNVPGSITSIASKPTGGQGIRRTADARKKGSVHEGFDGSGDADGSDDGELDC
jgi:hypothetical protein